jgi:mono/diheme cytochrome c family protein
MMKQGTIDQETSFECKSSKTTKISEKWLFRKRVGSIAISEKLPYLGLLVFALVWFSGCGNPSFAPNELATASFLESQAKPEVRKFATDASVVVESLFGTPDLPIWPSEIPTVVDMKEVERSAGPVGRAYDKIERGLYRKHCVQCHGITGDGAGPAALVLAPYPRDFRRGTFKFKSTPIGSKPKKSDLVRILEHGIPGTSMPAFGTLRNRPEFVNDIESLVEYVTYLSIRGEVERRLLRRITSDDELTATRDLGLQIAKQVATVWEEAESQSVTIPEIPPVAGDDWNASVERGRELFASDKTSCFKCHGKEGRGDGISQDYDEWTKDWTIRAGIDPAKKDEWRVMKPFGALKPVVNRSRNLHLGTLRGGSNLQDIAKRIALGIDGTPMPAAALSLTDPNALSPDEFADLVRFVASITGVKSNAPVQDGESTQ